jgi:hypothetical protein
MAAAVVALLPSTGPTSAQTQTQERTVGQIPYVTCEGSRWRASLDGEHFRHVPLEPGPQAQPHDDTVIHYQTWDGSCWRASWDVDARRFDHSPFGAGSAHPDTILNFLDWEGVPWTARREGDDWIVSQP